MCTADIVTQAVPYSQEAEEAVIGSLLIDRDAIIKIQPFVTAADFYFGHLGAVYSVISDLAARRVPADFVTLWDALQRRGLGGLAGTHIDYVAQAPSNFAHLVLACPTAVHVEYYAHIVADYAAQRRLITTGGQVAAKGYERGRPVGDVLTEAVDLVQAAAYRPDAHGLQSLGTLAEQYADDLLETQLDAGALTGVPTGLRWLDDLTGGLQPGNMYILAARPKIGKTALATQWAAYAAQHKHPTRPGPYHVAYFSLEMNSKQILYRLIAQQARLDLRRVSTGRGLSDADRQRYNTVLGDFENWGFYLDDSPPTTITEALTRARYRHATEGLDALYIDYLQLFSGPTNNRGTRQEEVAAVSRAIVQFGLEANIPVVALSQLSRAAEQSDDVPLLSHLRESGALEQDAAMVLFLTRKESDALLTVAANRHGPTAATPLYFEGPSTTFHEGDRTHTPPHR